MLIEKTIGTIHDYPGKEIEYVSIEWHECHKRIMKKHLANGEDLGIKLSDEDAKIGLKEGDVLAVIGDKAIAVSIAPCEALIVDALRDEMIPKVCYEIGNRHAPFFQGDTKTQFYTPYEMPIKLMLEKLGCKAEVGTVKLTHDRAISSAFNAHSHAHDDGGYDGKGSTSSGTFYEDNDQHGHHHHHDHEHPHFHDHVHEHDHGDGRPHAHDHSHEHNHEHEEHEHMHDHLHGEHCTHKHEH